MQEVKMQELDSVPFDVAVCMSKVPYRNHTEAHKALREIRKGRRFHRSTSKMGKIDVYYCRVCERWHHGHEAKVSRRDVKVGKEEE